MHNIIYCIFHFISDACVEFLKKQAQSLNLPIRIYHVHPEKPIVVLTWAGTQPEKSSILLNSHMDVVPVFEVSIIDRLLTSKFHVNEITTS